MILVTGSHGLIGQALCRHLATSGHGAIGLDCHPDAHGPEVDVRDMGHREDTLYGIRGIIHLAAVSRVVSAQQDPERCATVNIGGTHALLDAVFCRTHKPWVIFGSSREVYGQQEQFPVTEQADYKPMNIYAASKMAGELMMLDARRNGLQTATVRFSSVYGSVNDYPDRVIPAFARAAACGLPLRVEGRNHAIDITHVNDVVAGICLVIEQLDKGEQQLPPIHFVSGHATSLEMLASTCVELAGSNAPVIEGSPRPFDVGYFQGHPGQATALLGWKTSTPLARGLETLIHDFTMQAGQDSHA